MEISVTLNAKERGLADKYEQLIPPKLATAPADGPATESFDRSLEQQRTWDALLTSLKSGQPLTNTGDVVGELQQGLRRVESGFQYSAQPGDEHYNPLHIEPLIDQAADLLDRCLKDRAQWDETASKMFLFLTELHEYAELDRIHAEEVRAGIYDIPWKQSRAESLAEDLQVRWQTALANHIRGTIDTFFGEAAFLKVWNAAIKASWVQGLVPYSWTGQTFAGYANYTYGGQAATVAAHLAQGATDIWEHSLVTSARMLVIDEGTRNAIKGVSSERKIGLGDRYGWDVKNATFSRNRTLVARKYQDIKMKATMAVDGVLNYGKRLPAIRKRFELDFREALAKLFAIQSGLQTVYGYSDPFPSDNTSIDYYDECLLWTRRAIQWLIRFTRVEQSVVWPISVRNMIGESAWRAGLANGSWTITIPLEEFSGLTYVRLRGLSAFVLDSSSLKSRIWQIELVPPREGVTTHANGKTIKLDQAKVPPCQLRRVAGRDSLREPDVVGVSSLHNASPIGTWNVKFLGVIPKGTSPTSTLDDILIDLHVAFRRAV